MFKSPRLIFGIAQRIQPARFACQIPAVIGCQLLGDPASGTMFLGVALPSRPFSSFVMPSTCLHRDRLSDQVQVLTLDPTFQTRFCSDPGVTGFII